MLPYQHISERVLVFYLESLHVVSTLIHVKSRGTYFSQRLCIIKTPVFQQIFPPPTFQLSDFPTSEFLINYREIASQLYDTTDNTCILFNTSYILIFPPIKQFSYYAVGLYLSCTSINSSLLKDGPRPGIPSQSWEATGWCRG